ncbi:hypothetical protein J2W39_003322 [Variovorax paradoxus]|uniref:Uncharacterized protein n=1 Tax=Variovorax paradoxus TaxID=34073 RepID=A0AAW8EGM9_VARPD|nr:hypothetical protein [Variovorax paradoxus]
MQDAVPLYAFQGDTLQFTDCACADNDSNPSTLAAAARATRLPPRLPRARVVSDAATQAPNASFQMLRYDLFMHFSLIVQDAKSPAPRPMDPRTARANKTLEIVVKLFNQLQLNRNIFWRILRDCEGMQLACGGFTSLSCRRN